MRCVVSVLGKDRSGIVAGVSRVLAEKGANIDDISQTILDEIFSMTMLVTLVWLWPISMLCRPRSMVSLKNWAFRSSYSVKISSSSCTRSKSF